MNLFKQIIGNILICLRMIILAAGILLMLAALGAGAAGYFVQSDPLVYAALQQAACPWNLLTDLSQAWFGAGILFFCGLGEYLISRMISGAIKRLRYGF